MGLLEKTQMNKYQQMFPLVGLNKFTFLEFLLQYILLLVNVIK